MTNIKLIAVFHCFESWHCILKFGNVISNRHSFQNNPLSSTLQIFYAILPPSSILFLNIHGYDSAAFIPALAISLLEST
jgi:hypothetical protein